MLFQSTQKIIKNISLLVQIYYIGRTYLVKLRLVEIRNSIKKDLFKLILRTMINKNSVSKDQARVSDILEQIQKLNAMINLHKEESKDTVMVSQYIDMKNKFLTELKEILSSYEIEVLIKNNKAA